MNKTVFQVLKDRISDIAKKCTEVKPFLFMEEDKDETDESEEN